MFVFELAWHRVGWEDFLLLAQVVHQTRLVTQRGGATAPKCIMHQHLCLWVSNLVCGLLNSSMHYQLWSDERRHSGCTLEFFPLSGVLFGNELSSIREDEELILLYIRLVARLLFCHTPFCCSAQCQRKSFKSSPERLWEREEIESRRDYFVTKGIN